MSGAGLSPALAKCETSHVLLVGVPGIKKRKKSFVILVYTGVCRKFKNSFYKIDFFFFFSKCLTFACSSSCSKAVTMIIYSVQKETRSFDFYFSRKYNIFSKSK